MSLKKPVYYLSPKGLKNFLQSLSIPVWLIMTNCNNRYFLGFFGKDKHGLKFAAAVWAKHLVSNIQPATPGFSYNSIS